MKILKTTLVLSLFTLSGCYYQHNINTSATYYIDGKTFLEEDNWQEAKTAFENAWAKAKLEMAPDKDIALFAYEYGRTSGALCDWKNSERALLTALELDKESAGPIHLTLIELARMYHKQGKMKLSESYFKQGKAELDKLSAETFSYVEFADILEEYATVLITNGNNNKAQQLNKRAAEIRKVFIDKNNRQAPTPYGLYCG